MQDWCSLGGPGYLNLSQRAGRPYSSQVNQCPTGLDSPREVHSIDGSRAAKGWRAKRALHHHGENHDELPSLVHVGGRSPSMMLPMGKALTIVLLSKVKPHFVSSRRVIYTKVILFYLPRPKYCNRNRLYCAFHSKLNTEANDPLCI